MLDVSEAFLHGGAKVGHGDVVLEIHILPFLRGPRAVGAPEGLKTWRRIARGHDCSWRTRRTSLLLSVASRRQIAMALSSPAATRARVAVRLISVTARARVAA